MTEEQLVLQQLDKLRFVTVLTAYCCGQSVYQDLVAIRSGSP